MDFSRIIIEFLGLQDVVIEDIKRFKKDRRLEVKNRQKRSECFRPLWSSVWLRQGVVLRKDQGTSRWGLFEIY